MSQIKWLPEALGDIERLHAFLHEKNPEAAARAATIILEAANNLKSSPAIGRLMEDDSGRREWFAAFGAGAYVLRYRLEDGNQTAVILRAWYSREDR